MEEVESCRNIWSSIGVVILDGWCGSSDKDRDVVEKVYRTPVLRA